MRTPLTLDIKLHTAHYMCGLMQGFETRYLPQLISLPSVVIRRLCAEQGPDTTQLTLTSLRQP